MLPPPARFYVEGLGWPVHREIPGDVVFIQVNHGLILSLWDAGQMHAEAGVGAPGPVPCITLSHNLPSTEEVDRVMAEAQAAGADDRRRARHPALGRVQRLFRRSGRLPLGSCVQPHLGSGRRRHGHRLEASGPDGAGAARRAPPRAG